MSSISPGRVEKTVRTPPRILCLHGGGSNARIFKAQCRSLRAELSGYFDLVFAEAPFPSEPGPDVTSVYQSFGPFRRWLPSEPSEDIEHVQIALATAMDQSTRQGATGDWVAILGFSQGAKIAGSLLLRQQLRSKYLEPSRADSNFHFGVLLAGRGPLVSFDNDLFDDLHRREKSLRIPTIHVHGLRDPGLVLHQALFTEYCSPEARLLEWDGDHRVPIKTSDVGPLVAIVLEVAQAVGVVELDDMDTALKGLVDREVETRGV